MMSDRLDKIIAVGFLFVLVFTVLAHGTIEPWSVGIFELLMTLLILLWVIKIILDKQVKLKLPLTALPLAAFLIYGIIQSISWSGNAGQIVSLSQDVESTQSSVLLLFFLFIGHIIAANFFHTQERVKTLINFLVILGLLLVIFAFIQYFTADGKLYWVRIVPTGTTMNVTGPFMNRNHFAGYLNLIIPIPIALILVRALNKSFLFFGFAAIMMALGTIGSASRGGIISLSIELFLIVTASIYFTRRSKNISKLNDNESNSSFINKFLYYLPGLLAIVIIIGVIFFGAIWIGIEPAINRFSNTEIANSDKTDGQSFEDSRGWIWSNSVNIFKKNSVYGIGLGSYANIFPKYADGDKALVQGAGIVNTAHNDYLQILTDTGIIGAIIALWFIITLFWIAKKSLRSDDLFYSGTSLGIIVSILGLTVHSIFDFNLQRPSTSLLFLTLIAVLSQMPVTKPKLKSVR